MNMKYNASTIPHIYSKPRILMASQAKQTQTKRHLVRYALLFLAATLLLVTVWLSIDNSEATEITKESIAYHTNNTPQEQVWLHAYNQLNDDEKMQAIVYDE